MGTYKKAVISIQNNFVREYTKSTLVDFGFSVCYFNCSNMFDKEKTDLFVCDELFEIANHNLLNLKTLFILATLEKDKICNYLENAANGIVFTNSETNELRIAIKTILNNAIFLSPHIIQLIGKTESDRFLNVALLTKRETEILKLIAQKFSNLQIGDALKISTNSINNHRANIRRKLSLKGGKLNLIQTAQQYNV